MKRKDTQPTFRDLLLYCIDQALSTLGERAKSAIYNHLESKFALKKQDIPVRVGDFSDALEEIFGSGAKPLQILIMKSLNEKVVCNYKWVGPSWLIPDLTFEKYVFLLELSYANNRKAGSLEMIIDDGQRPQQQA